MALGTTIPVSVLSAYWRTRFNKNVFQPSRIAHAIAVQEPRVRTMAQRQLLASLSLYFAVVTAIMSWLVYDPSVGIPFLSQLTDSFRSSIAGFAGVIATVVCLLTSAIYAARWLHMSVHVLVLVAHASSLAVLLVGLDACQSALHTVATITGGILVAAALAPLIRNDTNRALAVGLAAWAVAAVVRGSLFTAFHGCEAGAQLSISLSVALVVLLLLMYDAVYVFRYIQCGQVVLGVAYVLVDVATILVHALGWLIVGFLLVIVILASSASDIPMFVYYDYDCFVNLRCNMVPECFMYRHPCGKGSIAGESIGHRVMRRTCDVVCCCCCWCFNEELTDRDFMETGSETTKQKTLGGLGKVAVVPAIDERMDRS